QSKSPDSPTHPVKGMRLVRRKDPAGPVHAVRRTGQPDPRFNYELFNCNNFNIRYWMRDCPPTFLTRWVVYKASILVFRPEEDPVTHSGLTGKRTKSDSV